MNETTINTTVRIDHHSCERGQMKSLVEKTDTLPVRFKTAGKLGHLKQEFVLNMARDCAQTENRNNRFNEFIFDCSRKLIICLSNLIHVGPYQGWKSMLF